MSSKWTVPALDGFEARKRAIDDVLGSLPHEVTPGARHIAMVTSFRGAQTWALREIVAALEALEKLPAETWRMGFMVAGPERFDVATSSRKQFANFQDFYAQEIAPTWGQWRDLIETYNLKVANKISDEEVEHRIATSAARAKAKAVDPNIKAVLTHSEAGAKGGRGNKASSNTTSFKDRGSEYLVRRLKKEAPEIAKRLAKGEFKSARAAGIAAGIVKVPNGLDRLRNAWARANETERAKFLKEIQK